SSGSTHGRISWQLARRRMASSSASGTGAGTPGRSKAGYWSYPKHSWNRFMRSTISSCDRKESWRPALEFSWNSSQTRFSSAAGRRNFSHSSFVTFALLVLRVGMGGGVVPLPPGESGITEAAGNFPQPLAPQRADLVAHAQRVEARDDRAHHRQAQ